MTFSKQSRASSCFLTIVGALCFGHQQQQQVAAQLNIDVPGYGTISVGGDNGTFIDFDDFDMNGFIEDSAELIGQSFENISLPPEIEQLVSLPTFENFSFSFGGNCTFCDEEGAIEKSTMFREIACSDWASVAQLGIPETSNQCTLLRSAAVTDCGCPAPETYSDQTCNVCPEGQEIGTSQGDFEDIIAFSCEDLEDFPAIDGDLTCSVVSDYSSQPCDCQPTAGQDADGTTGSESSAYYGAQVYFVCLLVLFGSILIL
jgi:hypothetical protein